MYIYIYIYIHMYIYLVVVSLMRPRCFTTVVLHTELLHTERKAARMIYSTRQSTPKAAQTLSLKF